MLFPLTPGTTEILVRTKLNLLAAKKNLSKKCLVPFYLQRPKPTITGLHSRLRQLRSCCVSNTPSENTKTPENCGFTAIRQFPFYSCFSVPEIYQLGPYKMSAFDNWNDYKSNTSSRGCKDVPLHSLWKLLDNVCVCHILPWKRLHYHWVNHCLKIISTVIFKYSFFVSFLPKDIKII